MLKTCINSCHRHGVEEIRLGDYVADLDLFVPAVEMLRIDPIELRYFSDDQSAPAQAQRVALERRQAAAAVRKVKIASAPTVPINTCLPRQKNWLLDDYVYGEYDTSEDEGE